MKQASKRVVVGVTTSSEALDASPTIDTRATCESNVDVSMGFRSVVSRPNLPRTLLSLPWYRGHINGEQEVMIGYSDSAKDAGKMAAAWAQYRAQVGNPVTCMRCPCLGGEPCHGHKSGRADAEVRTVSPLCCKSLGMAVLELLYSDSACA